MDRCRDIDDHLKQRSCYLLRQNWVYHRIPHEQEYFKDFFEENEKLNNQSGRHYTNDEALKMLDLTLYNEFDANWEMINYFFDGGQNTIAGLLIFVLSFQVITICFQLFLVCRNRRIKTD